MSQQVINACTRVLGKRPAVPRARLNPIPSSARAMSTAPLSDQTPPPSASSTPFPRLSFGKTTGFFNSSHKLSSRSWKWPTTPESAELRLLLLRPDSPAKSIYNAYLRLVNDPLRTPLPQTMHQIVLRRVVNPAASIQLPNFSLRPDRSVIQQETRLREIIFQMRAEGFEPTLADYHFVLEQLAAMGHQRAAYGVYLEIVKSEHKPTERTIALTLLALVRRHKMRIYDDHLGAVKAESHGIADRLLGDLLTLQQDLSADPVSPMCLDLACRVFKITGRLDQFLSMLKTGYGVDISQPDHLPLEFVERIQAIQAKAKSSPTKGPLFPVRSFPKFSTHTLNTTIDMLGRSGKVLEMVSAFEALTNPLPASARGDSYQYDAWEDDEPENASSQPNSPRSWLAGYVPSATPNTATLGFMIKHTVDRFKFDLCKHYLLLAIHLDRVADYNLRQQLLARLRTRQEHAAVAELEAKSGLPMMADPILSPAYIEPPIDIPRVSITTEMFTKVWGLSNQKAHMRSLRGLVRTARRVIRRKRKDIDLYKLALELVPTLGVPVRVEDSSVGEPEAEEGDVPSWLQALVEERPPKRRQFSLVAHLAMIEAETEKLEEFLKHGIRGVEHSSARIQAEMERKEQRKLEAMRAADELAAQSQKKKEKRREERLEGTLTESSGVLTPAI